MRAFSSAAARLLSAHPRLARTIARPPRVDHLEAALSDAPIPRLGRLLRQARRRVFLHTALHEVAGGSPLESARLWSDFADVAIRLADGAVYRELVARHGRPTRADGQEIGRSVLGLGKLGSRELNPSSDVDLLFAYGADDGRCVLDGKEQPASVHELFVRWVRGLRDLLAHVDESGFVFRVDLDLRPEGTTGALVNSVDALESYYERFGRTWERAALTRLRPILDVGGTGSAVLSRLRPFVFPRTLDLASIDELASMKQLVTQAASPGGFDVKRGEGGIREVEFVVQALQLVHAGKVPRLRLGSTVELLDELERQGLLAHRMARELREAYVALRRVEHALQYESDRQTQRLPEEGSTRERVIQVVTPWLSPGARRLPFDEALGEHRKHVHRVFSALLGENRDAPSAAAEKAVERTAPEEERLAALEELTLHPPEEALRLLRVLERRPSSPFSPALLSSRSGLSALAPRLLDEIAESPDPMAALARLAELFSGFVHYTFYERLVSDRRLSSLLVRVLAVSAPLSRLLRRQAGLEALLLYGPSAGRVARVRYLEALREGSEERATVDDEEEWRLMRMRRVQGRVVLSMGLAFLAGRLGVVEVGHGLSTLADAILEEGLALARRKVARRFGEPPGARFGLFALGRLGSRELGFFADVDIVFIYDADGMTTGPREISASEWAAKVAQQVIWSVSAPLPEGRCYEVDTRLRPSGNQGPLVTKLEAFARYHEQRAELWERQALLRLRPVAGDGALARAVMEDVRRVTRRPPPERLGMRLLDMRARMIEERAAPSGTLDLKMGEGGLSDIEFAVQGALLHHAAERPELLTSSTRRALRRLCRAGLVREEHARVLEEAFDHLGAAREVLTLLDDTKGGVVSPGDRRLELLARAWPQAVAFPGEDVPASAEELFARLASEAARVREVSHRVLVRLP